MKKLSFPLSWQILTAGALALVFGMVFPEVANITGYLGTYYIKILLVILLPTIAAHIISGITQITHLQTLGRIGIKNVVWALLTQLIAMVSALIMVNIIMPGNGIDFEYTTQVDASKTVNFGDFIPRTFSPNIFRALSENNLCAVALFCTVFGCFITKSKDKTRIFLTNFFNSISEVMSRITDFVARLAPIGVFGALTKLTATTDFNTTASKLWVLILTITAALLIHTFISLPLFVKISARCKPYRLMKAVGSVLFTSFGISSETLTMPMAINKLTKEIGISAHTANISMPFQSLTNSNGTAIFLSVATVFIAQAYGIYISISEQIILTFAILFISFGIPDMPLKFTMLMLPVLGFLELPVEGAGLVAGCEILFGNICPFVNMWGNICCTATIARSEGDTLNIDRQKL
ncbi:MAG: dicarboxylate/amino acid:cation symporter [Bacteroidales bacterium]|nr:dicarboxylate/amino acid:cation symporter [Bacteroidales bacterium]